MRVKYSESIKFKALQRLKKIRGNVTLRKDFVDLGSYRQISRILKELIVEKKLVKIGAGVYAKAYLSKYFDQPTIRGGFGQACKEALTKLGVNWKPGSAEQEYNAGLSTQVPVRTIVQLKTRFRGQLTYGNRKLIMEKGINAK